MRSPCYCNTDLITRIGLMPMTGKSKEYYNSIKDVSYDYDNKEVYEVDFKGINFSNLATDGVTFFNCTFKNCKFVNGKFIILDCVFVACQFVGGIKQMSISRFKDCTFSYVNFKCLSLSSSVFIGNKFFQSSFRDSRLPENFDKDNYISGCTSINSLCPEEGSFIGYKSVKSYDEYGYIGYTTLTLYIPSCAKRSSGTSEKCRASKVFVLKSDNHSGTYKSIYDYSFEYKVGEWAVADSFDEDRFKECSHGIHFFMYKEEADNYY